MSAQNFRVAIIGAGGIARGAHIPNWLKVPGVEIVALVDINKTVAEEVAAQFDIKHVFTTVNELLANVKVDAVDICTPNKFHTPAALAALEAGVHVMVEKPLAVTTAEIREMGEAADKQGLVLMTAQKMRFGQAARTIKKWVDAGGLGQVYHARVAAIRRNLIPPRSTFLDPSISGGGPCVDIGVHALDTAMFLMDFPTPIRVTGVARTNFGKGHTFSGAWGEWDREQMLVEDFAAGFIHFDNGATMQLESSWLGHQVEDEKMEAQLLGLKGAINWPSGAFSTTVNQVHMDGELRRIKGPNDFEAEILAFHEACVKGLPSPVPWQESFKVISILEAVYISSIKGSEITAAQL